MIKFFSKIRYNLMETGKTGKYLKYAIGEIILVMIGILLALQVNNWNIDRINSNKEATILANIHEEFKANKIQLERVVKTHQDAHSNTAKIINLFPLTSIPQPGVLDSLSHYMWNSFGGYTFNPSQTSINALINTSSFDIISNDELSNLLISWNDLVKDYQEEEKFAKDFAVNQYEVFFSKHFTWNLNFNKDSRNDLNALLSVEFDYLIHNNYDLLDQILNTSGELKVLVETLDKIIQLSDPKKYD
ncbi:DUF6090 family protein [Flavobacteriaceae bacterium S0862]|nr:DUF6090 family protein [Flavobacteriaceae bacterium S0862]